MTKTDLSLISRWNNYCEENNDPDRMVYENTPEFFDDLMLEPFTLLKMAAYGDYHPNHDYVTFNGYGNLHSSDFLEELIDMDELLRFEEQNSVQ